MWEYPGGPKPTGGRLEAKGLEPSTFALRTRRSPKLSYAPVVSFHIIENPPRGKTPTGANDARSTSRIGWRSGGMATLAWPWAWKLSHHAHASVGMPPKVGCTRRPSWMIAIV